MLGLFLLKFRPKNLTKNYENLEKSFSKFSVLLRNNFLFFGSPLYFTKLQKHILNSKKRFVKIRKFKFSEYNFLKNVQKIFSKIKRYF